MHQETTKIVFIHKGDSWYLPYVMHQARHASPSLEIVLVADRQYPEFRVELLEHLESDDLGQFRRNYSHMSTNSVGFELFCWERWFYLRNLMRREQIASVLHLDSDVLLYSSIEEIKRAYCGVTECALAIPEQGTASGHVSYWSFEMLDAFCRFTIDSFLDRETLQRYREKWDWHLAHGIPGGICDMTTLYLFSEANPGRVFNLARSHRSNVFDNNINSSFNAPSSQYLTRHDIKQTTFVDGHPFLTRLGEAEGLERVHALHFQGGAKRHIRRFYTGKPFPGKSRCDLLASVESAKRRIRTFFKF